MAHAGDNELALGSTVRALRSSSANAVTDDSLAAGAIGVGRAMGPELIPGLQLWAVGGLSVGGVEGVMFQTMTTQVDQLALTAGGRARYTLRRRLAVSGQLELGAARTALSIAAGGRTASDHGWGGLAKTSAAVDVVFPARFTFGLRLELGYVAASSVELTPGSGNSNDTIQLPMTQASFGHLDLGGPTFGVSVLGQF